MADGPSAEDTSSSSSAAATAALMELVDGSPAAVARVPRERNKRNVTADSSSSSSSSVIGSASNSSGASNSAGSAGVGVGGGAGVGGGGKRSQSSTVLSEEQPTTSYRRSSAGSSERRGTRYNNLILEPADLLTESIAAANQQLKIASAVVLVERSEIAIIENNRKKLKLANNNSSANTTANPGNAPKKDSGKKSDAASSSNNNKDKDNNKSQQQRKTTRKTTAEAKKANQQQIKDQQQQKQQQQPTQGRSAVSEDGGGGGAGGNLGPCAKKRCADQYDSSESSDSGVAVSCSDSSSGVSLSASSSGSDITEPGSPCTSVSSDEGLGDLGTGSRSSPTRDESSTRPGETTAAPSGGTNLASKLAPTQQQPSTRPQWPWVPPLALAPCSNGYKRLKAEPEHGCLPRQTGQQHTKTPTPQHHQTPTNKIPQQQQDSQGKITEYFKAQIKPQQSKAKKHQLTEATVMVAKTSEFRRPATVQRNGKMGLAKYYLGNGNRTATADWETHSFKHNKSQPRTIGKLDKKSTVVAATAVVHQDKSNCKTTTTMKNPGLPLLPLPSEMLSTLPSCKISNLRLTSEASPSDSPLPSGPDSPTSLDGDQSTGFKVLLATLHSPKPVHVNENNNVTSSGRGEEMDSLFSLRGSPATPSDSAKDEDEETSRDSAESKSAFVSPILSTPKTIRFPVKEPGKKRSQSTDTGFCRWEKCETNLDTCGALLEHLQTAHINTQTSHDNFVCHWQGCKVQGKTSCSRRWLERHVLSHGGNKPHPCIFDSCGFRFSSQTALERHVNSHLNQTESNKESTSRKSSETSGKLIKRNGKKLRYRKQPYSARNVDYFDSGTMQKLNQKLENIEMTRTQGFLDTTPGDSMTLTSQVVGKRTLTDGTVEMLLRWYPRNIEPDEWVLDAKISTTKHVKIRKIANENPEGLHSILYPAILGNNNIEKHVKQRRKPVKPVKIT